MTGIERSLSKFDETKYSRVRVRRSRRVTVSLINKDILSQFSPREVSEERNRHIVNK